MRTPTRLLNIVACSLVAATLSCSDRPTGLKSVTGIAAKILKVQTASGIVGTVKRGSPNTGTTGPAITVPSLLSVINGGTSAVTVTSVQPIYRLVISIDGVEDYYDVPITVGTTSTPILITLSQDVPESTIPLTITASDANDVFGQPKHIPTKVTKVGTGDVQISLSWDGASDVDLHVIGPDNDEIYYQHRTSTSGGKLDLDSNADCVIDGINNENVTWPSGRSPSGTYKVLVDYYASCGRASSSYVVTTTVSGQSPQVFTGTFTGTGDRGGLGAGRLITTFSK
jgi:hypothetical protein